MDRINELLYSIPEGVDEDLLEDLELKDIPKSRIEGLKELLNYDDIYISFKSARLLTNWGIEEGFAKLISLFSSGQLDGFIDHRLYGYDETYKYVLSDLVGYWAQHADNGNSELARKKIYPYVCKIIKASNYGSFDINALFWLVTDKNFTEYTPYLLEHLMIILDNPQNNYWRTHDVLKALRKVEPEKTNAILTTRNKTYSDFGL